MYPQAREWSCIVLENLVTVYLMYKVGQGYDLKSKYLYLFNILLIHCEFNKKITGIAHL